MVGIGQGYLIMFNEIGLDATGCRTEQASARLGFRPHDP